MLHALGGVELVGEAGSLDEAVAKLPGAEADVVLVDLFERSRQEELLATLREAAPNARMLIYTGMPEEHVPEGAEGHVHKSVPFESLHQAITDLAAASG